MMTVQRYFLEHEIERLKEKIEKAVRSGVISHKRLRKYRRALREAESALVDHIVSN